MSRPEGEQELSLRLAEIGQETALRRGCLPLFVSKCTGTDVTAASTLPSIFYYVICRIIVMPN